MSSSRCASVTSSGETGGVDGLILSLHGGKVNLLGKALLCNGDLMGVLAALGM